MRIRTPLVFLAGLAIGVGAGYLAFGRSEPPPAPIVEARPSELPAEPGPRPPSIAPVEIGRPPGAARANEPALPRQLADERGRREEPEGKPLSAPPSLDARFSQAALVEAMRTALKQTTGGDVHSVDCTEYPCVVYGEFSPAAGESVDQAIKRLLMAPALAPYQRDGQNAMMETHPPAIPGGPERVLFARSYYPEEDRVNSNAEVASRFRARAQEMLGTYFPRPPGP